MTTHANSSTGPLIGLLSPCGWGNLGDAAIMSAVIETVRSRYPDAQLYAATSNPTDTERRHGIPAHRLAAMRYTYWRDDTEPSAQTARWTRGLRRLYRRVWCYCANVAFEIQHAYGCYRLAKKSTLLIISGGGQLDDYWGGAWAHPYTLFKWTCASWLAGTPAVILSVGAGTARSKLARRFLRGALKLVKYRSFRDPRTRDLVRDLYGFGDAPIVPDLAFGLSVRERPQPDAAASGKVIGISPIAFCDPRSWPEKDGPVYRAYIAKLAEFVNWLADQGYRVLYFCTDNMDVHSLRDLQALTRPDACLESDADRPEPYYKSVDELLTQLARTDLVVASRLHGLILSHRLGKPALALSYDWKVDVHMADFGQVENCLDIRTFQASDLIGRFTHMTSNPRPIEARIKAKVEACGREIEAQYNAVFGPCAAPTTVTRGA